MKIIALERPEAGSLPGPPPDALLEAEARHLWELRGDDIASRARKAGEQCLENT